MSRNFTSVVTTRGCIAVEMWQCPYFFKSLVIGPFSVQKSNVRNI